MKVEIFSDVVCPWCAIGKARFETAVAQFEAEGGEPVEVVWRPFQLDPAASSTGTPVLDVYAKKFGGLEKAEQITAHVTAVAATVGWSFNFDIAKRANTFDAHRLLAFAHDVGGPSVQGQVKDALLRAYFTEGRNVGEIDELAAIGLACGLDGEGVRSMLSSGDYVGSTREEMDRAVELGISAVPSFVFNGVGVLPGAQEPEQFLRVLRRLSARSVAESDA